MGEVKEKSFHRRRLPAVSFSAGWRRAYVADYLIGS